MTYITLGSRGPIKGAADNTALNPGNWTIAFSPDIINVNVTQFEIYKIIVNGAPNTTFKVYVDAAQWDSALYGQSNSWDPQQPLIMRPGQFLYFMYSDPITDNNPPNATIWMRYDSAFIGSNAAGS
jgi:hypothetical protein